MTQKWIHLTTHDISQVFAQDEIDKLNEYNLSSDVENIIQTQLDCVADSYRAAFQSKGYRYDVREHYLPNSYALYALVLARYYIATRFPNSKDIFLDEPRKELFEMAKELLKNPYIGVPDPDYSDDPVLSGDTSLNGLEDSSMSLPGQRIFPTPFCGFGYPYAKKYEDVMKRFK